MREPNKTAGSREPLLRIAKRTDVSARRAWAVRAAAIFLALCSGGILILALGHNPLAVYRDMVGGALATNTSRTETVKIAIPLLGAAIAIAPAFKMRFWNIGAEGQIMAGAVAASYFALYQYQSMSRPVLLLCMFLAGLLAGGIWGLIPAVFKAKWGTNETLFTLMFNYIILGVERYLQNGPWRKAGSGFPKIAMFTAEAKLPKLFGVHVGWMLVLVMVLLMHIYLKYSKQGYEISVIGESVRTAQYAGMNVPTILIRTMFLSGAICGIVGFLQVAGSDYTLTEGTAGGVGFTAITVAWLAKLNPIVMVFIAAALAILEKGSNTIQTNFKIPASAAEVLIGTILFFMLGCEFYINYRVLVRKRKEEGNG